TAHLKVYGDTVTIRAPLKLDGKDLIIFARKFAVIGGEGAAGPPKIVMDGPALPDDIRVPKALPKGANPPNNPAKGKRPKGEKGVDASNNRIEPWPRADATKIPAGTGWDGSLHKDEMYGEPGEPGATGNRAGNLSILCGAHTVAGAAMPAISAIGGPGGNGQPGQEGSDGGDGGAGFDARANAGFLGQGHVDSCPGGDGGEGGNGGKGGAGGKGGDGGKVQV